MKPIVDDDPSYGRKYYRATHFLVYKLDQRRLKWNEVKSIGDEAFFIGRKNSSSIASQNLPTGWRKNCIYFADDYGHGEGKLGVYNLEKKRNETMPGCDSDSMSVWPPPIWVIPNVSP